MWAAPCPFVNLLDEEEILTAGFVLSVAGIYRYIANPSSINMREDKRVQPLFTVDDGF
uniref:hypothetical protein n=1 Tax=Acetobacteroides hydrogenigenes TaxID=979970 RepID=UPI003743C9D4